MKHYLGAVTIKADLSLDDAVVELNRFLAPVVLVETDRFDEVPGFVAQVGKLEFSLQGVPLDLSPNELEGEQYFYFEVLCSSNELSSLPLTLRGLPAETPTGPNGYSDVSLFLCQKLLQHSQLRCEVAR